MTYSPQIPKWGEKYLEEKEEKLVDYHNWLSTTGIKTGLISQKTDQHIWDEFIVHSLYFYKIIEDLGVKKRSIFDLGTGAGIPGIPISIVSSANVLLVDNKKSRIFELERLIKILKIEDVVVEEKNAIELINTKENVVFTLRCYLSTSSLIKETKKTVKKTKKLNNNIYLVSSNKKNKIKTDKKFHVKHEKFLINKNDYRFIDVITSM
tara:strand:- start:392 stop:1015 length:624 start_codon:yes stop_codon:yes gene_type:complete